MSNRMLAIAGVVGLLTSAAQAAPPSLAQALAGAKSGTTVTLSPGTYAGGLTLPPGVSLKGAGYGKTIIDASNQLVGLEIAGGADATIAGLTVRGATRIDISVHDASRIVVQRVRVTGSINGLTFTDVVDGRMENVTSDNNRYGLVAGGGSGNVIVNCTVARNSSLGIGLPSGERAVVFNNCIVESTTGIYLGGGATDAKIDYNLYSALYIGKMEGQIGRKSIGEWNYLSGQDAHGIAQAVTFRNPDAGDFTPVNPLAWALDRTPVTGFGVTNFAAVAAPATDILGKRRDGAVDLGAYAARLAPPRAADGTFTVTAGTGITSAGVFTKQGRLVCYLFHNLPLAKGVYPFWLPSRDFQYRPIAAGAYDVRTVESRLNWTYIGKIGDSGKEFPAGADASLGAARLAFDGDGRLLAGNDGWAEDFIDVRSFDGPTGAFLWAFRAGADTRGIVVAQDGVVYLLRRADKDARLTKLDAKTGDVLTWKAGGFSAVLAGRGTANGITELGGKLFVTDDTGVCLLGAESPVVAAQIPMAGASCPSADTRTKLVWVLTRQKLVALRPDGSTLLNAAPVDAPCALAVSSGRMAVASQGTGKIYLFDYTNPGSLRPLGSIGRGDGPFGAWAPDRFTFQRTKDYPGANPSMALGPKGELAVGDGLRILVFDAHGKALWQSFGVFGNGTIPSYATTPRCFDVSGWSMAFDLDAGTWRPEAYWPKSPFANGQFRGEIACQGVNFGVYAIPGGVGFTRVSGFKQSTVLTITGAGKSCVSRKDSNHDGVIDDKDVAAPFETKGLSIGDPSPRSGGDLMMGTTRWHSTGIDGDGAPVFSPDHATVWKTPSRTGFISPYTAKPDDFSIASLYEINDQSLGALVNLPTAPGRTGLFNGAGTDMAGFDAAGNLRWLHPLAIHCGLYNFQKIGPVFLSGVGQTSEIVCVNEDGLGLGTFGQSAASHYSGYWLDHPGAVQAWQGQNGQHYLLIADNYHGMHHWYRLGDQDKIVRNTMSFAVSSAMAGTLAAMAAPNPNLAAQRPATPTVVLPRLKRPLPIDGELEKWRKAGISPNIIITPDTAQGGIDGPQDASAVIRMAYQGTDLYVQILRFARNPVFFQPVSRHYMQDCVEMCINGFGPGFKFDISKTTDAGDIIIRERFFFNKLAKLLPAAHAPRVIKILDNAKAVSERAMIESVYGVDLAQCKVIVTEFKLPMDAATYENAEQDVPKMTPGSSFWLGFTIDDNNQPGADLQNLMVWPATYGTFNPPSDGAKAILGE
jgi:hypothetical protein